MSYIWVCMLRELENKRKKAEADEEQKQLDFELFQN